MPRRISGRTWIIPGNKKKMNTKQLILTDYKRDGFLSREDLMKLEEAAGILRQGGLVAFPTETVYGLGGDALRPEASAKIYAAKGRPSDNPLIVHICRLEQLEKVAKRISPEAWKMAETYWPGPLTMVFEKTDLVPEETTGGLNTVAVRFPSHPAARMLIERSGTVIAAPSANLSVRPSTTTAAHCVEDLTGRVDAIVDGGDCQIGLESTILDMSGERPQLLRPGAVTAEMIEVTLGFRPEEDAALKGPLAEGVRPKAPGMKYRHYAPKARMVLISPKNGGNTAAAILEQIRPEIEKGSKCAVLCTAECREDLMKAAPELTGQFVIKETGSRRDVRHAAHVLFELLREMDAEEIEFIAAEGSRETEIGAALMNMMKKAAAWQIIDV